MVMDTMISGFAQDKTVAGEIDGVQGKPPLVTVGAGKACVGLCPSSLSSLHLNFSILSKRLPCTKEF